MYFSKLSLLTLAATLTLSGAAAHADSLTLGNSSAGGVMTITIDGDTLTGSGGNFVGSTGVINNKPVTFSELFCVSFFDDISFGGTYSATDNNQGKIDGSHNPLNNDAEIAWLILNVAPGATTEAQNQALQIAIWEEEYGKNNVQLDSVDTGVASLSQLDYNMANSHVDFWNQSSLVNSVDWITPENSDGSDAQAQVGIANPSAVPEPASLTLFGTGILGLAGVVRRRLSA
jgi:hypothetical protein